MAKIRVHELAKELEKENKEIIAVLQELGVEVKSHMSAVEDEAAGKIRGLFASGKTAKKTEKAASKEEEPAKSAPEQEAPAAEESAQKMEAPAAPPKKKNIIQVFRPQNSKTGMVKPGGRPRPQGQGGMRLQGQPGLKGRRG